VSERFGTRTDPATDPRNAFVRSRCRAAPAGPGVDCDASTSRGDAAHRIGCCGSSRTRRRRRATEGAGPRGADDPEGGHRRPLPPRRQSHSETHFAARPAWEVPHGRDRSASRVRGEGTLRQRADRSLTVRTAVEDQPKTRQKRATWEPAVAAGYSSPPPNGHGDDPLLHATRLNPVGDRNAKRAHAVPLVVHVAVRHARGPASVREHSPGRPVAARDRQPGRLRRRAARSRH